MIHLLAFNICDDYLLKLINLTSVEQTLDIEEDTDNDSEDNIFDDEYLVTTFTHFKYRSDFYTLQFQTTSSFQYLQSALPQSTHEILIPPLRA